MTDHSPASLTLLTAALRRFGRFRRRWAGLLGLGWFGLVCVGSLLAWVLLDWWLMLPPWPLFLLFVLVAGLGVWGVAWWLVRPWCRRVRPEREALVIEALHGRLDNQIIGALQLGQEVAAAPEVGRALGYAPELVAALVARTSRHLEEWNIFQLLDRRQARRCLGGAAVVSAAFLALVLFGRAVMAERIARLQDAYAAVLDTLFPVTFKVSPGDITVVRGRPVRLGVEVIGARRRAVQLVRTDLKSVETVSTGLKLERQQAELVIPRAEESFRYVFVYGHRRTTEHTVQVGDLPELSAINFELTYPAYTGQPPRTLTGQVPRLQALNGTGVLVSFAATTDLHPDACSVQWQDGSKQQVSISGRFGHFSFTITRPDRAEIRLTGALGAGFEMARPVGFEVAVQRDAAPIAQVLLQNRKLVLLAEEAAVFALPWMAEDDFGVEEVNLEYRIDTVDELLGRPVRQTQVPRLIEPAQDRVRGKFTEVFKDLSPALEPGDRITMTVIARDNNTETGPGVGRSLPVEIVVVRPDLAHFAEQRFAFGVQSVLGGLQKIQRATDLLVEPQRSIRTEPEREIDRQPLKSRISQEPWPSGAEDAVGDYFNLLAGER